MSSGFGVWCFLWLAIGCVIGFGAGILYLFLLGSSPEGQGRSAKSRLPLFLAVVRGGWTAATLFAAAGICYGLKFDKTLTILVLVAAVLVVSKLAGPVYGLAASVVAVVPVAYFFLPPVGSLRVTNSEDQLALVLFLLTAITGSRLVGGNKGLHG